MKIIKTAAYQTLPPMDPKYGPREGLEGPFRLKSGKIVYYDPKEGKYYDPSSDFFMEQDDYDLHQRERPSPSPPHNPI